MKNGNEPKFRRGIARRVCRPCRRVYGIFTHECSSCGMPTMATKVYNQYKPSRWGQEEEAA